MGPNRFIPAGGPAPATEIKWAVTPLFNRPDPLPPTLVLVVDGKKIGASKQQRQRVTRVVPGAPPARVALRVSARAID